MRVVLDTNVIVDHMRARDIKCSEALTETIKRQHVAIVCEKLLREYRKILAGGNPQFHSFVDCHIMQLFQGKALLRFEDPKIRIDFGPQEDRFHMQLAIDAGAAYHVTKDGEILAETDNMARFGVNEAHPATYVYKIQRERRR